MDFSSEHVQFNLELISHVLELGIAERDCAALGLEQSCGAICAHLCTTVRLINEYGLVCTTIYYISNPGLPNLHCTVFDDGLA